MKIVINTISTKENSGGAFQIAYNFLLETLQNQFVDVEWLYITSSDLDRHIGKYFANVYGIRYFVFPTQPDFKGTYRHVKKDLSLWEEKYQPDVIFSISSPCYFSFKTPEVMRFANAWITNPNKMAWKSMPLGKKIRMFLYRMNQFRLLRKANYIITQSETVKKGLMHITRLPENHIRVVPNVLPKVFAQAKVRKKVENGSIDIICASAPMPHKNLDIIPCVLKKLKDKYKVENVRFHLTIPDNDNLYKRILFAAEKMDVMKNIVNHGRCTQHQLCEIYNQVDFCFLSTLLETFSASSLEAMHFGLCIVATDFEFNKEVIRDAGLYYRPMDAEDAANKLFVLIHNSDLQRLLKERMKQRLLNYSDYSSHFIQTVTFLREVVNEM